MRLILIAGLLLTAAHLRAATITTGGSGNWSSTVANAPWPGGTIPAATDDIVIGKGFTLTVDGNRTCNSISIPTGSQAVVCTLAVNSGVTLTVTTAVSLPDGAKNGTFIIQDGTGPGTLICASLNICSTGTSAAGNAVNAYILTSTISNLTINGNLILNGNANGTGNKVNNPTFDLQSGTVTVGGSVTTVNAVTSGATKPTSTFTTANGAATGILVLSGATPFNLSANPTNTMTFNGTGATVKYIYAGPVTVYPTTYTNLTLDGSGAKTTTGVTVNGILSMEGTATASAVPTYGTAATLQYKGSATQTTGPEFPATFSGTGGVIINNSNGVNLNSSVTITNSLTFSSGKITTGANNVVIGSSGSVIGAGSGMYVYGNLQLPIATGTNVSKTFDIGDATNYTPVTTLFASVSVAGNLKINTTTGQHPNISTSGINSSKDVNRYWTLTNSGITFTNYSATLNFAAGDVIGGANTSNFVIRNYSSSTWTTTTIGTKNATNTQATGLTMFGDFAIGEQQLDHFVFSLSSPQINGTAFTSTNTLTAQDILNATFTAFDLSANNVTIAAVSPLTGTVSGLSGGNKLTSAGDFSSGVANLTTLGMKYIGNTGAGTFTATSADSKTGTSGSVTINIGTISKLVVTLPGETFTSGTGNSGTVTAQTAGTSFNIVRITATDAGFNTLSSYSGAKTISYTGPGGSPTYTTAVSFSNGQSTTTLATTLTKAETTTITASDGTTTGPASSSLTVNPGALDHFTLSAIGSPQTAGTAITGVTLTAQDVNNNTVTSFTSTVSYSGTAGITGTSTAFTSGVLSGVSVTPTVAGTGMTFIVTGSGKTGTATFNVNPGALDHFALSAIGSPQTAGTAITGVTVTAQDVNNNTVTSFTSTVSYSGTAGITGTSAAFTSGVLSGVSVTPTVAGTGMTFIVTGSGKTGTATFNVNPGAADATQSTLTPTSANIAADGVSTQVLTVTAKDANGNFLTSGGLTVTITLSSGTGLIGSVTDNSNGTYTATVTAPSSAGSGVFVATLGGNPVKSGTGTQSVSTITYVIYVWNQTGTASWTTAANWTPSRTTPAANDVIQFSGGGTVTITDLPNESIGRLLLSGNSSVNLQPTSGSVTLTVSNALIVTSGDVLNFGSGVVLALTSATLTNSGTIRTAVLTSTSAAPIPTGKTWGGNVQYDGSGAQTVISGTYNKLTLAGSGIKTLSGNTTISSTLSMQGTATFGPLGSNSLTYGAGAGLEYAGSGNQTTGPELPTSMSANITINNTNGVVTLGSSTTFTTATWSVATGASLEVGLTIGFTVNSGTVSTQGSGKIILDEGSNYVNLTSSAPMLQVRTKITGSEGWRMLAAPNNVNVGSMFANPFVTQGFTGSSYPSLQPNLMSWDETSQGTSLQAWRQPSGNSDAVTLGKGYMYFVFNGALRPDIASNYSDVLPLTMTTTGTENPLDPTAFDYSVTATARFATSHDTTFVDTNAVDYGWNLVGNPTPSTINWDASSGWTKTNMDGTIYIWDPATSGYKSWNGTTGNLGSGKIAPFQAFWVKANAASPSLKCDNDVKTSGGAFLGKIASSNSKLASVSTGQKNTNIAKLASLQKNTSGKADTSVAGTTPILGLELSANGFQTQAYLMFSQSGKLTYDPYDAFSLVPLSNNYLILYSVAGTNQPAMQIQNLPDTGYTRPFALPLYVGGTVGGQPLSGSFTLRWNWDGQLPAGWNILLMDDATGTATSITEAGELTFQYTTPSDLISSGSSLLQKKFSVASNQQSMFALPQPVVQKVPNAKLSKSSTSASRFRLVISANGDLTGYLPTSPQLAQNYPNPFNPTTNISFSIPTKSRVAILVFNILGQRVATVTDQEYPAGNHVVLWNATNVASGVYFCRMTAAEKTQTKKMVVLR
ncbi:MAG: T9SS type A sorting domain-containing protein [Ignavibacteriales bacterium]|nr:T9SS type A sorting domain-containing protein [Ignavibacteriales bacterium]